jgi:hypothetical protein
MPEEHRQDLNIIDKPNVVGKTSITMSPLTLMDPEFVRPTASVMEIEFVVKENFRVRYPIFGKKKITTKFPEGLARVTESMACDGPEYIHDETTNRGGAGVCNHNCECDGSRKCVDGLCQGFKRILLLLVFNALLILIFFLHIGVASPVDCNSPTLYHDESTSPQGSGKCADDCQCYGNRRCVEGDCQSIAREPSNDRLCNSPYYIHDELCINLAIAFAQTTVNATGIEDVRINIVLVK